MKWEVNASQGIIVGGGNGNGSEMNQLNIPAAIYRTRSGALYVADERNQRIMHINIDTKVGTIIAGGNGRGSALDQFSTPIYITLNPDGDLYVSDSDNDRVQLFIKKNKSSSISGHTFSNRLHSVLSVTIVVIFTCVLS